MYKPSSKTSIALAAALVTASCATGPSGEPQGVASTLKATFNSDDPCSNNARNIGIVGGVVAGVVVGKFLGAKGGKIVAVATVGALMGGLIGSDVDRRRCDLSKVAKAHNLDIVMTDIRIETTQSAEPAGLGATAKAAMGAGVAGAAPAPAPDAAASAAPDEKTGTVGMSLTVFDHGGQFASGSALPSPDTLAAFGEVADKYRTTAAGSEPQAQALAAERMKKMRILLVGHTDDTGPSQGNADLSEARARAIAKVFAAHGFSEAQLFYQGAGEVFPIGDNHTAEGQARNRRVEVVDLSDEAVFTAFLESRRPNVARYRQAPTMDATTRVAAAPPAKDKVSPAAKVAGASRPDPHAVAAAATARPAPTDGSGPKPPPGSAWLALTAPVPSGDVLDFGGKPFDDKSPPIDIGKPRRSGTFSFISTAYAADNAPMGTCATDRPRLSNRVKALSTGRDYKSADYLPGTAASSWSGKANGHLVGLSDVAVLRDGGLPSSRPTLYIWKNYVEGSHAKPDVKTTGDVNAYQGDKALLYRVFPVDGPLRCIDMVIPRNAPSTAPESSFVYVHTRTLYQSDFSPIITR